MIWTPRTIAKVEKLFAQVTLDHAELRRPVYGPKLMEHSCNLMIDKIVELAKSMFEVDVHRDDVAFKREDDSGTMTVTVRAKWQPSHGKIELVGGQFDGREVEVPPDKLYGVFKLAEETGPVFGDGPAPAILAYDFVGWHPEKRRWVYKLAKPVS